MFSAGGGKLSALLGVHANTPSPSPVEFASTARGQAVRAALGESRPATRARTPAGSASARGPSRRSLASAGLSNVVDATFTLEAKLTSAEQQARLYRERISLLERQLHVALAANKRAATTLPSTPQTHSQSPLTHSSQSAGVIDHFPPPPSHRPHRPSFNLVNEEKQSPPSSTRLPPRSRTTASTATVGPGLSTPTAEVAGLHQLLDEHEVLFATYAREVQALRAENERLRLQVALSQTLTGLVEHMVDSEQEQSQQSSPSPRTGSSHWHEQKEVPSRSGGLSLSGLDPLLLSPAINNHLQKGLPGMQAQGAPTWLVQLLQEQANDPPMAAPPIPGQLHSPLSTPSRVFARSQALKYVLSTLSPSLNMRDRGVTALFDEFVREHAWLANAFSAQSTLVNALVEHLRKKELGLDDPNERAIGIEYFRRREMEEREERRAQLQAQAHGHAARTQPHMHPHPPPHPPPPHSGLMPGSAGVVSKPHTSPLSARPLPSSASASASTSTSTRPVGHSSRNAPVQVDGGGSANIALGAEWLAHSSSEHHSSTRVPPRPFQTQPELAAHVEALQSHIVRFVMGAGIEPPASMLRQEQAFSSDPANHSQGYSEQLGGTPSAAPTVPAAPAATALAPLPPMSDAEAETLRRSRVAPRDLFRERDGAASQIPASVRKWSTVEQLDYVTANEYAASNSTRKPKKKHHERGASRSYTQTALGALSEHSPDNDDDAETVELADPFAARDDLKHSGSAAVAAAAAAAERARVEQAQLKATEAARGPPLAAIHRLGASQPPALVIPPSPGPHSLPSLPSAIAASSLLPHPVPPPPAVGVAAPTASSSGVPGQPAAGSSSFSLQSEYVPLSSLKLLYELLKFVSFKLSHTSQLKHVVHVVRRLVGADRVTLWFVDHFRGHIWSQIGTAVTNEIRVKLGVGIAGSVAASGRSVTMLNATYDQRFLKKVESGTDYITRACMCIPLKTPRNGTFAVLQIMNKTHMHGGGNAGAGHFSRGDELLAHLACQHLAQNLWGSEMLQLALREKLKTQLVFRHADQLLSCLDVKEMLTSLVARVRMLVDADYAVLFALGSNAASEREATLPEDADEDESDSRPSTRKIARKRPATRGGASSSAPWSEDASANGEASAASAGAKELLSITESCTASIAIIIPQGYAADRREGFKFNAIRVPLSSGGLATQAVQTGRVTNIFDTRLDARFNADLDEYISDTVGSGSGSGKAMHSTRALLVVPISGQPGAGAAADGVLVLGKLVPKPFQEWEVAELDELRNILWMGVRRYRADRVTNLRMYDRLTSVNRMIATLDLEAGGTGLVMPVGAGDSAEEAQIEKALAVGAVVVTEEATTSASLTEAGVVSMAGKMKDPVSGELLPSLVEYQRQRMLFPTPPQLGSSLADAFYKNELTRSRDHPHGTLHLAHEAEFDHAAAPLQVQVAVHDDELDESEMRDPRAPPLVGEVARRKNVPTKPAETLQLQREADALEADQEPDEEEEETLFPQQITRKRTTPSSQPPPPVAAAPQPLKPLDYSKATFTAPPAPQGPLLPSASPPAPSATSSSPVPTSYKPQPPSLLPVSVGAAPDHLAVFHEGIIHGKSDGSSSPYGGDSSISPLPTVTTISRITLSNTTDFPEVDALKNVTYGVPQPRSALGLTR